MNGIPREFDWVRARASCTAEKIFSQLHSGVLEDVRIFNELFPATAQISTFEVETFGNGSGFRVKRSGTIAPATTFSLNGRKICISSESTNESWSYEVGLNDEGRCQLRQHSSEFEMWQVRKTALHGLLFNS